MRSNVVEPWKRTLDIPEQALAGAVGGSFPISILLRMRRISRADEPSASPLSCCWQI
jgi:hypothetical protein